MFSDADTQAQALWRFREQTLKHGAVILALARSSKKDREPLYALHDRQIIHLSRLLHEFSFNARKAIELAEQRQQGVVQAAKTARLRSAGKTMQPDDCDNQTIVITTESFWWIICRLVHSTSANVYESCNTDVDYRGRLWSTFWPRFFNFSSDLDSPGKKHYISIDDFLECFHVHIDPLLVKSCESKNGCRPMD